jgi:hypothetical protein
MSRISPDTIPRQYNSKNVIERDQQYLNIKRNDDFNDDTIEKELSTLQKQLLERIDLLRLMERKNQTLENEKQELKLNLREVELKIGRMLKRRDEIDEGLQNLNLNEV